MVGNFYGTLWLGTFLMGWWQTSLGALLFWSIFFFVCVYVLVVPVYGSENR